MKQSHNKPQKFNTTKNAKNSMFGAQNKSKVQVRQRKTGSK